MAARQPSAAPPSLSDRSPWRRDRFLALALLVLVCAAYLPALGDGFVWDDDDYVLKNQALRSLDGLRRIWFEPTATPQYYPLVFTTFWAEYHLWGLAPLGYHAVNVLLHAANCILLFRLLRHLNIPGAWLAAALFALHPVQVESVAWITERKNTLSALLYLAAMLAYLRFSPLDASGKSDKRHWGWYGAALALFVAALLSKTVTCSLPAAILLLIWWRNGRWTRRDLAALVPFFVIGAGLASVTLWMEKHHVLAEGNEWRLSPIDRCLIAGRALWFYAGKLAWPQELIFIYPRWHIDARAAWQYLFPAAALGVIAALWFLRRRLGRGPLVAVLLFAGTLVPALGFFNVYPMRYSFVADHFQYLASVALLTLAAAIAARAWQGFNPAGRRAGAGACGAILLLLGVLTWRQCLIYKDLRTLWSDTLAKDPDCWMAHHNFGIVLSEEKDFTAAIHHYREALRRKPSSITYYHLGVALANENKNGEAAEAFREATRLQPAMKDAHQNLGAMLASQGKLPEAADEFLEALRLDPSFKQAEKNLELLERQALARGDRDLVEKIERRKRDILRASPAAP